MREFVRKHEFAIFSASVIFYMLAFVFWGFGIIAVALSFVLAL